jgi:hypothetical protein
LISFTHDLRLLWAPSATYDAVAADPGSDAPLAWARVIARVAEPAAILGIVTVILATDRVSWSLALSGIACWSFVAMAQLVTASLLFAPSPGSAGWRRSFELFFLGHAAWSLWLLAAAVILFALPQDVRRQDVVTLTAPVPMAWTATIVFAFCRRVLHLGARQAALKTAIHQSVTYLLILLYVSWAVQLWPRILSLGLR